MILSKKITAILYIFLAASVCEGMEGTEQSPEALNLLGNTHWNAYLANPTDPTANESLKNAITCWERSADYQPSREKLGDLGKMADANIQYMLGNVYWDSFERDPALLFKKKNAILRWLLANTYDSNDSKDALEKIISLRKKGDSVDYFLIGSTLWEIYKSYPNRERLNSYAINSVQYLIESTALMLQSKGTSDPAVYDLINKILESALAEGNPAVLLGLADVFYTARFGNVTMFGHGFMCLHALIKAKNMDVDNKMIEIFSKSPDARIHFNKKMSETSKAQEHRDAEVLDPMTIPADGRSTTTTTTTTTTPPVPSGLHEQYLNAMAAWKNPWNSIPLLIEAENKGSEEAKAALDELRKSASYQVSDMAKKDSHGFVLRSRELKPIELSANKLFEYANKHWTTDTPEAVLYLLGAAKKGHSNANKKLETIRKSKAYKEHLLGKNFEPTKLTPIEIVLKTMDFPGGVDFFHGEKPTNAVYTSTPQQSVSPRANTSRGGSTRKGRKNKGFQPSQTKTPTSQTQRAVRNDSTVPSKTKQTHESPNGLYERGSAYLQHGNSEEAKPLLRAAGEQGNIEAMSALGVAYTMEKNYAEANKFYLRAISLGSISAMANYGMSLRKEGNFDEAERYLKMAIEHGYATAIDNIALLYKEQNRSQESKNYLATLIKKGHTNAATRLLELFIENLEGKEAEEIFRPLVKGGNIGVMNSLGFIYAKEENYTEAKKWFLRALKLGSTEGMRNYGEILGREGNFGEAETYLKKAIEQGHVDAIENISLLYKKQNKIQEGTNYLLTLIKERDQKRNGTAIPMLFQHFMKNRQAEEVEELLLPLTKEGNTLVMNNLGIFYMTCKNYKQAEKHFKLAIDNGCALSQSNLNLMNRMLNQQETHPVEGASSPEAKAEDGEIASQSREEGDAPSTRGANVSEERNNTHPKRHRPGLERSKTIAHLPSLKEAEASSSTFEQPDSEKSNREKPKKTLPPRPVRRTVSSNHLGHPEETAMKLPENSVGGKKTLKTRALDFLKPTKHKGSPDNGKDKDKSADKKTKSKKSDSTSIETRSSESKEASGKASKKTLTRKKSSRSLKSTEEISPKAEMPAEILVSLKKLPELPNDYSPEHNELLCEILTYKFELDTINQNTLSIILNRGGRKIDGGDIRKLFKELFKNTETSEDSNAEMSEGEGSNTEKSEDSSQKDIRQTGGSHKVIKSAGLTLNPKAEGSKRKKGSYHGQLNNAKVKIVERIVPKLTMVDYEAAQKKE